MRTKSKVLVFALPRAAGGSGSGSCTPLLRRTMMMTLAPAQVFQVTGPGSPGVVQG